MYKWPKTQMPEQQCRKKAQCEMSPLQNNVKGAAKICTLTKPSEADSCGGGHDLENAQAARLL